MKYDAGSRRTTICSEHIASWSTQNATVTASRPATVHHEPHRPPWPAVGRTARRPNVSTSAATGTNSAIAGRGVNTPAMSSGRATTSQETSTSAGTRARQAEAGPWTRPAHRPPRRRPRHRGATASRRSRRCSCGTSAVRRPWPYGVRSVIRHRPQGGSDTPWRDAATSWGIEPVVIPQLHSVTLPMVRCRPWTMVRRRFRG